MHYDKEPQSLIYKGASQSNLNQASLAEEPAILPSILNNLQIIADRYHCVARRQREILERALGPIPTAPNSTKEARETQGILEDIQRKIILIQEFAMILEENTSRFEKIV